jgi:hypothetical protein
MTKPAVAVAPKSALYVLTSWLSVSRTMRLAVVT